MSNEQQVSAEDRAEAREQCAMMCAWKGGSPCILADCPRREQPAADPLLARNLECLSHGELVRLVERLVRERRVDRTSDRIDFLQRWMRTPNPMLGNTTPLDMMRLGRGHKLAEFIETQFELNGGYCSERDQK